MTIKANREPDPDARLVLDEPPTGLEFEQGERVKCWLSGVAHINLRGEWDEWKLILEKVAREHGVTLTLKLWLDTGGRTLAETAGGKTRMIAQLAVDDPSLPLPTQVVQAQGDWPQHAIWGALHRAGLVLEREPPKRRVRDTPQA